MRIALDATYSVGSQLSGVGVYSNRILAGLSAAHPGERFLFCYRPHRFLRSFGAWLGTNCSRRLLIDSRSPAPNGLFHGLNQRLPTAGSRHTVCTFHDLFVLTGDYSTREFRERFALQAREAAARADLIVAVSEFTASQVEQLLGVERGRIRVVHHGVDLPVGTTASGGAPTDTGPGVKEPIILHTGAIQLRKNVARLVEAFERCPAGWRLVLAGSHGHGAEEILARIERSPRRPSIELPGYLASKDLQNLYRKAAIFAFPSLDEGFGMPVLEAMAHGAAVVTSNRSALPEVAGDAALLVDPFETDNIAEALARLIEDEPLRREIALKGQLRADLFPWSRAVDETWAVYRELTA